MNDILAEKMDSLRKMGVLATPEECGVVPEFMSPSMLVPKGPDSPGEWRLVTAFTGLNKYIKKMPAANPTVDLRHCLCTGAWPLRMASLQ